MIYATRYLLFFTYLSTDFRKGGKMVYKLAPKNCDDVKTLIEAKTKKAAISYFAALLHLSQKDLLKIYKIT